MIEIKDLKQCRSLSALREPMLEKLVDVTSLELAKKHDTIFRDNESADRIFCLQEGLVGLGITKNSGTIVWVAEIFPCRMFGLSAIADAGDRVHMTRAKALSPCKLLSWRADDLEELFSEDHEMGYLFMREIAGTLKKRLRTKNIQFTDIYT